MYGISHWEKQFYLHSYPPSPCDETTTGWDGCWAWMDAIYMVFVPSCAPEGKMHVWNQCLLGQCSTAAGRSTYMYLCFIGSCWKWIETVHNVSAYFRVMWEFIPKFRKSFFSLPDITFLTYIGHLKLFQTIVSTLNPTIICLWLHWSKI